jgi:NAD(P)H dehydrogenase (quinone)
VLKPVANVRIADVLDAEGLIAGSPSYYGTMAAEMKRLFDRIISGHRDRMARKVGATFATSAHPTGGLETTMVSILQAMLVAGLVVVGDPRGAGGHYGVGCAGAPDERVAEWAAEHGRQVAELVGERVR